MPALRRLGRISPQGVKTQLPRCCRVEALPSFLKGDYQSQLRLTSAITPRDEHHPNLPLWRCLRDISRKRTLWWVLICHFSPSRSNRSYTQWGYLWAARCKGGFMRITVGWASAMKSLLAKHDPNSTLLFPSPCISMFVVDNP